MGVCFLLVQCLQHPAIYKTFSQHYDIKLQKREKETVNSERNNQLENVLTEEVTSGLQYGVGQLAAKSAKLNKTSISESNPANSSNT